MHLKGQDSPSHAILGLAHDRKTSSQRLTLPSTPDLNEIFGHEANDVVKVVAADVRLSL